MIIRRVAVVGIVLAGMLALGGCDGSPAPAASTPPFASEEEAFAAAEETYRAYVDALNEVDLADPETFEPVFALTTGEAHADIKKAFTQMHADGWTVTGRSVPQLVQPRTLTDDRSKATLDVCLDVSAVDVTDDAGESQVDPGRVDVQAMRVQLSAGSATTTGWSISEINGRDGEPTCAAD